jgi:hypothetical protein
VSLTEDRARELAADLGVSVDQVRADYAAAVDREAHELIDPRRLNLAELIQRADDRTPWRVDRLAADGYATLLAGRGGEGKSLLAIGMAGAVLTGGTVAGIPCEPGRALILDAENGPPLIGRRLKLAGIPLDGLGYIDAAGLDLAKPDHRAAIGYAARQHRAQLVVLDSLRTLAPGVKENDSDDMAPIVVGVRQLARDTGAAVVLLHHRDKALAHDFRGSGAIHDQMDLVFVLGREEKDPMGRHRRYLRCSKCRIDEEPTPRWLTIKAGHGELHFREAAAWEDPRQRERSADVRDELAGRALAVLREAGEPLSGAAVARALGRDATDRTVRRALDALNAAGTAHNTGHGWVVTNPDDNPAPAGEQMALRDGANGGSHGADDNRTTHGTGQRRHAEATPVGGAARDNPTTPTTDGGAIVARAVAELDAVEVRP